MADKKISVSVDPSLVSAIDKCAAAKHESRSSVVEEALLLWYRQYLESEDEKYYSSQKLDNAEAQDWSEIRDASVTKVWESE
ncbi:MAG: ribbon-helix-helix domain-containing protein [Candidatus Obscuribacterales bacterium]|nr:ribbon-helix-helix domain-containing protein [Candidatus Obscuribacterales bacterium]